MKRLKRKDGFTVTEVIIALVILSVGLLGLVTTAALVTRMIGRGHRSTTSALYAQEKLEEIRGRLVAVRGCTALAASGSDAVGPAAAYRRTWRITPIGVERRVDLVITYPSMPNRDRTDLYVTFVSCAP